MFRTGGRTTWKGFGGVKYAHANTLVTCNDSNDFSAVGSTIIELSHCWTSTICGEAPATCSVDPFAALGPYGTNVQFGPVCGHPQGPIQIDGRLERPGIVAGPDRSAPSSTTKPGTPASSSESFEKCQEVSRAGKIAWDLEHIQFSSYDPVENSYEMNCELLPSSSSSHQGMFPVLAVAGYV